MKRNFFSLAILLICLQLSVFSQKSRVGATAGVVIANMSSSEDEVNDNKKSKIGFTAGLIVEAPISNNISFQPGLHYVQKGMRITEGGSSDDEMGVALRYAELTMNFVFNSNGENGGFFIGAGPTFSAHLPSKTYDKVDGEKTFSDIKFGDTEADDVKGYDFGGNVIAGVRTAGGFILSVNYTRGFYNLVPGNAEGVKLKNSVISVKLGILVKNK